MKLSWLQNDIVLAEQNLKKAKYNLALSELSIKIFNAVYDISKNERYAYDIAKRFLFDDILKCKEFEYEELNQIQEIQAEYLHLKTQF